YNVVELFIFKFLSDLGVLKSESLLDFSTLHKLSQSSHEDALKHYAKSIRTRICDLFPEGSDGTTLINGTIFVTEKGEPNLTQSRLFCELLDDFWEYEKEQGTFKHIDKNFKTKLFESFLKQSAGIKRLGQFFTPRKIVQAMVQMSDIGSLKPGNNICDPFCGVGGFLLEAINLNSNLQKQYKPNNNKIETKIKLKGFDQGTEEKEDERTIILAKANMLIYLAESVEKYHTEEDIKLFSNIINETFELIRDNLGTLKIKNSVGYDIILSNPPYVSKGSKSIKKEIYSRGLSEYYTFNGTGIEGQCVEWIVRNLNIDGQALIIIPDSILRRSSDLTLRNNIIKYCYVNGIISLPHRTFYATAKKTYILVLTKKESVDYKQDFPILSYLVRDIGESRDANRIETPDKNDLPTMLNAFNQYKGNKNNFKTNDPLCKVLPFTYIENSKNWIIENNWSRAEKEKLSIVEENPSISIDEFRDLIKETMTTLSNLQYNLSIDLKKIKFDNIQLGDTAYFKPFTTLLGFTQKTYLPLATKNKSKIPIYTAQKEAVAYIDKIKNKPIIECSSDNAHISIASDGDGTAGTNIIYHTKPYYLNTSRISYEIKDKNISPQYIYYALQGIKQEYGFNYSHKATLQNQAEVNIIVPIKKNSQFDLIMQKKLSDKLKQIEELKASIKQLMGDIVGAKISLK
ncbi:MAG TPA: N-6 DNA methylase, partial [Candidatus Glassbacteria bacterium]|nr:N-6 DNA methylase [Candidatus Glassbacteria bacterium]